MASYIIRRLLVAILVVVGVAAVVFAILHYLSPSPAYVVLGTKASPQAVAQWDAQHGYDRSEFAQFFRCRELVINRSAGRPYKFPVFTLPGAAFQQLPLVARLNSWPSERSP